ncbi:MAG: iron ABC transporter permease [Planctomycetota bacterium]
MDARAWRSLAIWSFLLSAAIVARLVAGRGTDAWGWPDDADILDLRVARVAAGVVVGSALALAGVLLQCLLRNPLASPDLLGLSTGAGLGVSLAMFLAYRATGRIESGAGLELPALIGASLALAVVFAISHRRGGLDPGTLILVGVIVAIICGAGIRLIQHLLPDQGVAASRWLMGALRDDQPARRILLAGGLTLAATIAGAWLGPAMDAASLSEDEARSLGVPLGGLRAGLFIASGVLASLAVVIAGPIGFVGLVGPHAARLVGGPAHRGLVIGAAIAGAALVVGADTLVRVIETPTGRIPIGVITALIGGPLFIALLLNGRRASA